MIVKRAFADITEGQVHYWHGAPEGPDRTQAPLIFLHPGPGTARHQVPILSALADNVRVIAPDIMGMGDSAPPPTSHAPLSLTYFADAVFRFLDSIGTKEFVLMGSSLGGRIAVEMALLQPVRVKALILNRMMMLDGEDLEDMKVRHAPFVPPDQTGAYIWFVWNRLRDLVHYFPWFKHDAAHRRNIALPSAELLHVSFVEHIKMCATSHHAFTAYWKYPVADKLRELKVPVLCRSDTAAYVAGASIWSPVEIGEPLNATPDRLAAFAGPVVAFIQKLKII